LIVTSHLIYFRRRSHAILSIQRYQQVLGLATWSVIAIHATFLFKNIFRSSPTPELPGAAYSIQLWKGRAIMKANQSALRLNELLDRPSSKPFNVTSVFPASLLKPQPHVYAMRV
jgi:hypothetical protein